MANQPNIKSSQTDVSELFARAAHLSAEHGVDLEAFVGGAYSAYLDARPGMREYLEDQQLRERLEESCAPRVASRLLSSLRSAGSRI